MAILVTGGKGFIGSHVIRQLAAAGKDVVCFEPKATPGRLGDLAGRVTMAAGDIVNFDDIARTIAAHKIESIAHLVFYRGEKPEDLYRQQMIMHTGTFHVFEAARLAGIRRVLFPSSIQYHGHDEPWTEPEPVNEESPALPTTGYGIGKHLCEWLAREYNRRFDLEYVTIRVPGVYGPGVRLGARGVNLIGTDGALGRPIVLPYPREQHVVLAHVEDVARMFVNALLMPHVPHEVYHAGGHYVSYGEIGALGQKLVPGMQVTFDEAAPLKCSYRIDSSRMTQDLGVEHRSLDSGYRDLANLTRQENGLARV